MHLKHKHTRRASTAAGGVRIAKKLRRLKMLDSLKGMLPFAAREPAGDKEQRKAGSQPSFISQGVKTGQGRGDIRGQVKATEERAGQALQGRYQTTVRATGKLSKTGQGYRKDQEGE